MNEEQIGLQSILYLELVEDFDIYLRDEKLVLFSDNPRDLYCELGVLIDDKKIDKIKKFTYMEITRLSERVRFFLQHRAKPIFFDKK